jgi:hypothetical protein
LKRLIIVATAQAVDPNSVIVKWAPAAVFTEAEIIDATAAWAWVVGAVSSVRIPGRLEAR